MPILEVIILALALSVDAFAVSLAAAAAGRVSGARAVFRLSFHFGLFQFLMPILGWAAGERLQQAIESFDHWIAAGLLVLVGANMLHSATFQRERETVPGDPTRGMALIALSTAVSIDVLAVGLSLAMLGVPAWTPSIVIGLVAVTASLAGLFIGSRLKARIGSIAEVTGGVVLIVVAVRIVLTHTAG